MSEIVNKLKEWHSIYTIIVPLWGAIAYGFWYESQLVKLEDIQDMATMSELNIKDLDSRIERTEILVALYSRDSDKLTEFEKNQYERAKARLIKLEEQRDKALGVGQ